MAGRSGARLVVLLLLALVGRRASWRPVALISGASEGWYAGMVDYWGTFYRRTWPLHPLGSLFRAAPLSPEEQAEEKKMQEAYFTDDSLRGVLITVGASLPVTLLTLLIFEHFLRGEPGGLLQSLGLPRMLFSETSASRPAVVARRPSDGTELRAAMPDSLRRVIAPPPLSRWRQKPPQRSGHVSAARRKFTNKLRLRLAQLLRVLLTVNERTVLECAGMDALVMLRFCALCGRFCALSSLWCLLLVFCFTAGGYLRATEPYRGLGLCSISNVGPNSRLLWAVVPVSYLCTLTLCGLLWREYERFVQLRRIFFLCGGRLGERPMLSDPSPREPWPHGSATDEELNTDARFTRGLTPPTMARLRTAMPGVEGRRREATAAPEEDLLAQTRRTVLVERLPPELREPGALQAHFEEWLGAGTVHSVSPVPSDAKKLSQCWRSLRRGRQRQGSLRDEDLEELSELELHLRARREEFHLGWSTAASRMHIRSATSAASLPREAGFGFNSAPPFERADSTDQGPREAGSGFGFHSERSFERADSTDQGMFDGVHPPPRAATSSDGHHADAASSKFNDGASFATRVAAYNNGTCRDSADEAERTAEFHRSVNSCASSPKLGYHLLPPDMEARAHARLGGSFRSDTSCEHDMDMDARQLPRGQAKSPRLHGHPWRYFDNHRLNLARFHSGNSECGVPKNRWRGLALEIRSATRLSFRTSVVAVRDAAAATLRVAQEIAGSSVRHVEQLVPSSALGTPAPASGIATPFGDPRRGPSFRMHPQKLAHMESPYGPSATAFVTLRTLQAATVACSVVLDDDPAIGWQLSVEPAPEPRDIVWQNMARKRSRRLVRRFFVEGGLLVGIAFWSVPVSMLQAWCSMTSLNRLVPCMRGPLQYIRGHSTELYAVLALYTPVAALLLLMEVLPVILQRLAEHYEGVKSHSEVQLSTMRRYWWFQLATIYVTVLSGSISDSLTSFMDHPANILEELAEGLPKVAVYFLATVLSSALVVGPISLIRLPMLFQAALREARDRLSSLLAPAVPREAPRQRPEDFVDSPNLAADLSAMLFVLVVCVTYATVAPLMMLAGLIFFVVRWQVLAVRYLYVHVPRFDSGGAFWYLLWNQALLALLLGNLTTVAVVASKAGYGQLPFLLPLLVLPLAFKMRAEYRFLEASRRLSLTAARQLDANDPRLSEHFVSDAYWHPALRFSEAQPAHADPWAGGGHMPLDAVEESWNMEATTPARGVTMEACYPADPGK